MSERLIDLLLRLSGRERVLLALAVFVILPVVIIVGWLLPLAERHDAAIRNQADAQALRHWIDDRVAEQKLLTSAPELAVSEPIGSSGIEQGLIDANLRRSVSEFGSRSGGAIELRFDEVDFLKVANWMSASHPGWGYDIESFRFEARDISGKVSVWLVLSPPER